MVTYKDSGVDLEAGHRAVERIAHHVKSTYNPQVLTGSHGGFAGLFQLDYPSGLLRRNYREPVLVACTDGVGTKLEVAYRLGIADTIGIDLVAMCVNDLVVQGAEPLFFLDYIAVGEMSPELVESIVKGIAQGCRESRCAILGGETAEMPGFYRKGRYELAGFSVGVVEKRRLISGKNVRPGDQLVGLLSSGIHSNGYSLVRKLFFGTNGVRARLGDRLPGCELPLGSELLRPTRIYVRPVLDVLRHYRHKKVVKAMAHITGGGLPGNLPRVLPGHVDAVIDRKAWRVPQVFRHIRRLGKVSTREMFRVFNMGIGLVMVVAPYFLESIIDQLQSSGTPAVHLGAVVPGTGRTRFRR
ncbi:MAG: phosphoribosylformylglycinamidine cyclo-ligase [Planctomycetota bacterium]|nr:phosphoribosylformylglycinamidine cyclo-ligase [Planctomycetota bacterium]